MELKPEVALRKLDRVDPADVLLLGQVCLGRLFPKLLLLLLLRYFFLEAEAACEERSDE